MPLTREFTSSHTMPDLSFPTPHIELLLKRSQDCERETLSSSLKSFAGGYQSV